MSTGDLHIPDGTKSLANNSAIQTIQTDLDIDGLLRDNSSPDIGADEFAGVNPGNTDAGVLTIDDPILGRSKKSNTTFSPKVTFINEAINTASSIGVNLTITRASDNSVVYNQNSTIASLLPFTSTQVTFASSGTSLSAGDYIATATVTLSGDEDNTNDVRVQNFTVKDPLVGGFSVGSGQTYTSLSQAITDLKDVSIGGAVILNLQTGTYNETPITISGISGLNGVNSLLIKAGGIATINVVGTPTEPWGIRIRGVEGVTIDGSTTTKSGNDRSITLNVSGTSGKYGVVIDSSTSPRTQRNTVKNLKISNGASSTLSSANYYGIWLNAVSKDTGNQIINCEITNFGESGIRTDKQYGMILQNNFIHGWSQVAGATTLKGIWLNTGTSFGSVIGNNISDITNLVNGNTVSGIRNEAGSTSNLLCANNMISNIRAIGSGSLANVTRGIFSNATNANDKYVYNSINLNGVDASSSSSSHSAGIDFGVSATSPRKIGRAHV